MSGMKRRDFIKQGAVLASTMMVTPQLLARAWAQPAGSTTLFDATATPAVTPVIVLPAAPLAIENLAAEELALYLGKVSGTTIAILKNDAPPAATPASPQIIVGRHPLNAGLKPDALELEESVIQVEPNVVHIAGGMLPPVTLPNKTVVHKDRGILYGVHHFLREYLGIRWYRPEAWGEHVPEQQTIRLPIGVRSFKPAYTYRFGVDIYCWYPDQTPAQLEMVRKWAVRNQHHASLANHGGVYSIATQHNYQATYMFPLYQYFSPGKPDYNPDVYAKINGQPVNKGAATKLCLGNPQVQKLAIEKVVKYARANPHVDSISLEPSDGAIGCWCDCTLCRAMDDPNLLAVNGREPRVGNASMANRVSKFNNIVAQGLVAALPDTQIKISWLAYLAHTEVPTLVPKFHPNTLVAPTSMAAAYGDYSKLLLDPNSAGNARYKEILQGYGQRTNTMAREYWSGGYWFGPLPILKMMKDRFLRYRDYNVIGVKNEVHPSWGPQSIVYYFYTRWLWDPTQPFEEELQEYCENYFGPAAVPMYNYYELMEDAALSGPPFYFLGHSIDRLFAGNHEGFPLERSNELVTQLCDYIDQAVKLVTGNQLYEKRMHGVWAGNEVVRLRNLRANYKRAGNVAAANATWKELETFIKSFPPGEVFDAGPAYFNTVWKHMTSRLNYDK